MGDLVPADQLPGGAPVPQDQLPAAPAPAAPMEGWRGNPATDIIADQHSGGAMDALLHGVYSAKDAAVQGASEGFGTGSLTPFTDATTKALRDAGIFNDPNGPQSIIKGFAEGVIRPLVGVPDFLGYAARTANALYHGVGDAAVSLGLPRDLAGAPEAFFGNGPGTFVLHAARDLGVVGKELPSLTEGTPKDAAEAAVNPAAIAPPREGIDAVAPSGEVIGHTGPPVPAEPAQVPSVLDKAGNIRLDLISDSSTPDALGVIRRAAEDNGGEAAFMEARRGDIPLAQVDALGQTLGMDPGEMNLRGIGRLLRNDNEVRIAIQAMLQSADEVAAAMHEANIKDDLPSLLKFQELRMRHSILQEQVAGLTSEWGRTGNVFQEFRDQVKDAQSLGKFLADKKGESVDDLRNIVKAGSELDPRTQLPRFMNALRTPSAWDKFMYYWTNSVLSGPFTHAAYALANLGYSAYDAGVVTPLAGAIGKTREMLGAEDTDRVFAGEAAARLYGIVRGTPDAIIASYKALKTGVQTATPREAAKGTNAFTQQVPIPGALGAAIGVPSRVISGIHSFFNFLGYRSEIEAQAYRDAAKSGASPLSAEFWNHQRGLSAYPTEPMMDSAVENGARLTFTTPLGEKGEALQKFLKVTKVGQLVMPFVRTPMDLLKTAYENTPLAYLDKDMRANLRGENGGPARDTQWARLVAGSSVMAMAAHWASKGILTGDGPADDKERAIWNLTHKPNSVNIGGYWVSYTKFGSIGGIMNLAANLYDVAGKVAEEEYGQGAAMATLAATNMLGDAGFRGLADLVQAVRDPERYGFKYIANFAASTIPYSSFFGQVASAMDPYMRETRTFVDTLKNKVPKVRETLLPVRDWTGAPRANDRSDVGAIFGVRAVNADPVDLEMQRLDLRPSLPAREIKGVKLSDPLYNEFLSTAGALTRTYLERLVRQPSWATMPTFARSEMIRNTITGTRQMAEAAMQAKHPELITQAMKQKMDAITGANRPR